MLIVLQNNMFSLCIIVQSINIMGNSNFCYFYINQQSEAWTCIPLFAVGMCLLIASIWQYRKNKRMQKMNSIINLTYISMFISLIAYMLKLILSQLVYWIKLNDSQNYLTASKYEFVLDNIGIYAMQSTVLLVPANWFRNIYHIFRKWEERKDLSEDQQAELKNAGLFQHKSYQILFFYGVVRVITLFGLLIPFIVIQDLAQLSIIADIILFWWLIQSAFLFVMLILGVVSLKKNKLLQQILQQSDYKLMIRHYALLIICTILRLITDIAFVATYFLQSKDSCPGEHNPNLRVFYIVNILLQGFLTFYLSVFFVLQIYKVEGGKKTDQLKSIIQVQDNVETRRETKIKFIETQM